MRMGRGSGSPLILHNMSQVGKIGNINSLTAMLVKDIIPQIGAIRRTMVGYKGRKVNSILRAQVVRFLMSEDELEVTMEFESKGPANTRKWDLYKVLHELKQSPAMEDLVRRTRSRVQENTDTGLWELVVYKVKEIWGYGQGVQYIPVAERPGHFREVRQPPARTRTIKNMVEEGHTVKEIERHLGSLEDWEVAQIEEMITNRN